MFTGAEITILRTQHTLFQNFVILTMAETGAKCESEVEIKK